jgi:phosphoesterase RecJ-like protein
MAFDLIKALGIPIDVEIATCLYTSITFDTQLFRYVKASYRSHEIASELLKFPIHPERIHQNLFGLQSLTKMKFLADIMKRVEILNNGRAAFLAISSKELETQGLEMDDSRDVIDLLMNIEGVQVSCLIREDFANLFKLSFRSKGSIEVLEIARDFGGGGHKFAAGASTEENIAHIRKMFIEYTNKKLNE